MMNNKMKNNYLAPMVKVVEFRVEVGYQATLRMTTTFYDESRNSRENFWEGDDNGTNTIGDYSSTNWDWSFSE